MATIRKRGQRWHAQVRLSGHPALTKSFILRADAEAWARQQEVRIEQGDIVSIRRDLSRTTLRELLVRYRDEVSPTKRSHRSEAARIGTILRDDISDLPLSRLDASAIASYRDERLKLVSGGAVRRELTILQHCLKVAMERWGVRLSDNPVQQVARPGHAASRTRRLLDDELGGLLRLLSRHRNPLIREVFLFALASGLRRGEVLSLLWTDVNLSQATAHLPMTKNGEPRTVPLSPSAMEVLTRLNDARHGSPESLPDPSCDPSDDRVFPISANAFRLAWERVKKRAGIKDLRFHDLRHEAISRFFEMGLTVPEVSLISGHKDPRMLFRYTHLRPENVARKLALVSEG
jgi:integrase